MGYHQCCYCSLDDALTIGVHAGLSPEQTKECYYSSKEYMFRVGENAWHFPAMLPLYVALGYEPPAAFVDAVMHQTLYDKNSKGDGRIPMTTEMRDELLQGDDTPSFMKELAQNAIICESIGFLDPENNPLPGTISTRLPQGFLQQLQAKIPQGIIIQHAGGGRLASGRGR